VRETRIPDIPAHKGLYKPDLASKLSEYRLRNAIGRYQFRVPGDELADWSKPLVAINNVKDATPV
jgi:hypothetical protein